MPSPTGPSTLCLVAELPLITSEDLASLAPEWAALHARITGATAFQHPAWAQVWLRHFGQGCAPVFLSVRRGEELVGVATLDMERAEARELGDHNVRDYAGPLALPGEETAVASGILEWLREDLTHAVTFWGIPRDSAIFAAFQESARLGWTFEESPEAVCPGVDLPATFEEYVAALTKKDRHELRRKLRNFATAGHAKFTPWNDLAEIEPRMDRFFELMRASRDDKDEFLTPQMEAFFRDLVLTFAPLGMLHLGVLTLDGAEIAMTLSFENSEGVYLYNSGYDPTYSNLSVGLVSKAMALEDAIERGKRRFDFLRGDEDYKRRLGGIDRPIVTVRLATA